MKRKTKRKCRKTRRRRAKFEDIIDLTVDLSKVTVATSAGLALMQGAKEALK